MCVIFGERHGELQDRPVVVEQGLEDKMRLVLDTLTVRERRMLVLRFGLEDGKFRTYEEVGREFSVTRERIRQIERVALKRLRHPRRSRQLKPFLWHHTDLDLRVDAAREELCDKLSHVYPPGVAEQVVRNLQRRHLASAFRSVESALRFSCGLKINYCLNCAKPLPPGWTVCDRHCRRLWRTLTLVCDGCGREFRRHEASLFAYPRHGERQARRRTFCCRSCHWGKDGTGPPCQTCGRPKMMWRRVEPPLERKDETWQPRKSRSPSRAHSPS